MSRPIPSWVNPNEAKFRTSLGNDEFKLGTKLLAAAGFATACPCIHHDGMGKIMSPSTTDEEAAEIDASPCIWPFQSLIQHYLLAGLGARDLSHPWEDFTDPDHRDTIQVYADNIAELVEDGFGLTLVGRMGTGKTSAATYIARRAVNLWGSKWVTVVPFSKAISAYKDERIAGRLETSRLLVIDEMQIGNSDKQKELFDDRMSEITVSRYQSQRATIITANYSEDELASAYPRMMSRLGQMNDTLIYTGPDYRKAKRRTISERLVQTG